MSESPADPGVWVSARQGRLRTEQARRMTEAEAAEIAEANPAKVLLAAVTAHLDEQYPLWRTNPQTVPAGLRMEMHPRAHYMLVRDPETNTWPREPGDSFEELYARTFRIPVKITSDLPEGYWRLVVVTEDVLLGGRLAG